MDLLSIDFLRAVTAAVLTSAVTVSCGSTATTAEQAPAPADTRVAELADLVPVRPDESRLGSGHGRGPRNSVLTGDSRDLVYLYGSCVGGDSVQLRLTLSVSAELDVPCDGIVSRLQVYTNVGEEFALVVEAESDTRWNALVTTREES